MLSNVLTTPIQTAVQSNTANNNSTDVGTAVQNNCGCKKRSDYSHAMKMHNLLTLMQMVAMALIIIVFVRVLIKG